MRNAFLTTTFLGGALIASAALAQGSDEGGLEEIVVTATRTVDTANRVPLSIAAVTQENMDQQGIKTTADLVRFVPSLSAAGNPGGAQQTFAIRGIVGSTGAATTSVYLDDTNLTKRSNGGVAQNNGVVVPLLYDLERVEVLKGPQGTLYGGSSEGGTVRYITPTPSLTEYTGSARLEGSTMGSRSELSHEAGLAFGGPIIKDKLGFRISGIKRTNGGWVDVVSAYTGQTIREDANSTDDWAVRGSLLWQINDRGSAQLSAFHVDNKAEGGPSTTTAVFPYPTAGQTSGTFTTAGRCITNNTRPTTSTATYNATATVGGPAASPFVPINSVCTQTAQTAGTVFFRPGATYGPFVTGQDISLATGRQAIVGSDSSSDIASLTLNYDFENMNVKAITSYLKDEGNSNTTGGEEWSSTTSIVSPSGAGGASATGNAGQSLLGDTTTGPGGVPAPRRGFPLFQAFFDATGEGYTGSFIANNKRRGMEQEIRFASTGEQRLSWVSGAFFATTTTNISYRYLTDPTIADLVMKLMYGPTFNSAGRYGFPNDQGFQSSLDAEIKDTELAAFTEANFWIIPDTFKATAGVRLSRVELDYYQLAFGQLNGRQPYSSGAVTQGKSTDSPVTPKFALQYQINENNMTYLSASKGFRAGGVNAQISQTICATALSQLGITADEVPAAYDPDTVWSYELGGKFRLMENLQVNLAVYRIDWDGIQATTTLTCGQGFTANGGAARSKGAELQVQYRPIHALNLYLNAGYTDAYYVDPVTAPRGASATAAPTFSFNAGDKFDIPPLQISAGGQYEFALGNLSSYVRLDYSYQNAYTSGATFGTSGYSANFFTQHKPSQDQLNLRAGIRFDNGIELNAFVQNLLDRDKQIVQGLSGFGDGRGTCSTTVADCSAYTSFNPFVSQAFQTPRRYGLQANYKF